MALVQGGLFNMGCTSEQGSNCSSDEKPSHIVRLSNYYIGKYEVTEGQWKVVMGSNPSYYQYGDDYPVEYVSWNDIVGTSGSYMIINGIRYYANGFIYKLNQLSGKQYRLPTEAEWEYAARGGDQSKGFIYSGSNILDNVAWYWDNSSARKKSPVGAKAPNELGIYDMSGNVREWCGDWYGHYGSIVVTDPSGPSAGTTRVYRGGGWTYEANDCRVSNRDEAEPIYKIGSLGFRVVLPQN